MEDYYKIAAREYCRLKFSYKGPYNNLKAKHAHFNSDVEAVSKAVWLRAMVDAVLLSKSD